MDSPVDVTPAESDKQATANELATVIKELKAEVRAVGLTDAEILAELEAYNAERRKG